jgi:transcriptional regulator with XRE-family HTH domain
MSQRRLAEELGYDPSFLSRIETGRVRAPRDFLDRLTGVEGLRLSWQDRDRLVQLSGEPAAAGERWPGLVGADPLHSFLSGAFGPRVRREASVNPDEKRALGAYLAGRLERLGRSWRRSRRRGSAGRFTPGTCWPRSFLRARPRSIFSEGGSTASSEPRSAPKR